MVHIGTNDKVRVTAAKVIDKFDEGGIDDDDDATQGNLKRNSVTYLSDTDKKYLGKATSRKDLKAELGEESFSENSDEDLSHEEDYDEKILSDDGIDEEKANSEEDDDFDEEEEEDADGSIYGAQQNTDEDETADQKGLDGSQFRDDAVQTFSKAKVSADVAKGQGIKNQNGIWDQLLEGRIKLQKVLVSANQLPQHDMFALFKKEGGAEFLAPLTNSKFLYIT
ncbi:protein AATF-like [Bufo gargarizans]|uniref:protein AATF-like n=1 Tax=Bufo gargarizans TaxID=30331 RepID=UPI001CF5AD7A|nr:protein AATF-like [Bufo gargarizans]